VGQALPDVSGEAGAGSVVNTAAAALAIVDPLLTILFPSQCVVCRRLVGEPSQGPLCSGCFALLPRHQGLLCGCGVPLACGVEAPCGRCRRGLTVFETGGSLGPYEGSLRTLLHALKYGRRPRLAGRLADALVASPVICGLFTPQTLLVPVPLHPRRQRERGFNQSEHIARALGRRTGLPVLARTLVRRRDTPPQTGLTAAQRRQNVSGAFAARASSTLQGRTVILIDDVLTTGATVRACGAALLRAGAAAVRVLTVARVE
jgi:ComF family protein